MESYFKELADWALDHDVPSTTHAYGPRRDQVADLRLPDGDGPHPVAVVVHGGFWEERFGRETTTALAVALALAGWASWNVEYRRLGGGGGVPTTLADVLAATEAVRKVDADLDRTRPVAIGHSTGAQLALWLAGTERVGAAVGLAGVCDLEHAARVGLGDGAAVRFAGGTPEEVPEAYRAADPMRRLPTGVPQLLLHGSADPNVPSEHSRRYEQAARRAGDRCELVELDGANHFDVIDPRSEAWTRIVAELDELRPTVEPTLRR